MRAELKWTLALLAFVAVAIGSTMYSASQFDEAKSARIEAETSDTITVDSIYSDRIEGQYDPDYDPSRYQMIAKSLESDPIYIDAYQAFAVDEADLDAIREQVSDLDIPIYVAFITASDLDDADGEVDLIAARIATELSDDKATVLVIGDYGNRGISDKGVIRRIETRPARDVKDTDSEIALDYVRALAAAEIVDAKGRYSRTTDEEGQPIVVAEDTSQDPRELAYPGSGAAGGIALGLIVGGGLGVGGVLTWRYIRKRRGTKTSER